MNSLTSNYSLGIMKDPRIHQGSMHIGLNPWIEPRMAVNNFEVPIEYDVIEYDVVIVWRVPP